MWKSKWYCDQDRYYGVGTIMNACWNIESSYNLNRIDFSKSWNIPNNNSGQGLLHTSKKLVDWQMVVAPGLM